MPDSTSTTGASGGDEGRGDQERPDPAAPQPPTSYSSQTSDVPKRDGDDPLSAPDAETDSPAGFGRHGSGQRAPEPTRPSTGDTQVMSPLGDWSPSNPGQDRAPSVPAPPEAPPLDADDAPPVSFVLPGAPTGMRSSEPAVAKEADTADSETTVAYNRGASGGYGAGAAPTPGAGWQSADAGVPQRMEGRPQRLGATPPPPPAPPWPRQQPTDPHGPAAGMGRTPEPSRPVPPPYQGVTGPNPQRHPGDGRGYGPAEAPRPPSATPPVSGGEWGQPPFGGGERYPGASYAPPPSPLTAAPPVPSAAAVEEQRSLHGGAGDFAVESGRREGPQQGWRSVVSRMGIPVGKGPAELEYDHDIATINKRLRYRKTVGVAAFKGGVGKTSVTMCLASTVAAHRQDGGVVAIDTVARGSLAMRVKGEQPADGHVKALAYDENLHTISDVRAHLMSNPHRLSVLGSHRDLVDEPLSPQEYLHALGQLHRHHEIVFVDTEPSVATPAYSTIMASLDALILVVNPSRDSAIPGREVLPWLRAHGLSELAARTIVLLNHPSPAKPHMNEEVITNHFHNNERVEVLAIPYDAHLAEAGAISLGLLDKTTRRQFVSAAAILLDKLPAT